MFPFYNKQIVEVRRQQTEGDICFKNYSWTPVLSQKWFSYKMEEYKKFARENLYVHENVSFIKVVRLMFYFRITVYGKSCRLYL